MNHSIHKSLNNSIHKSLSNPLNLVLFTQFCTTHFIHYLNISSNTQLSSYAINHPQFSDFLPYSHYDCFHPVSVQSSTTSLNLLITQNVYGEHHLVTAIFLSSFHITHFIGKELSGQIASLLPLSKYFIVTGTQTIYIHTTSSREVTNNCSTKGNSTSQDNSILLIFVRCSSYNTL